VLLGLVASGNHLEVAESWYRRASDAGYPDAAY
jgi:hypothetical protein